ncbi:hypothetical protein CHISP_2109 [Chitinispirillum alkaliphilum]|nr:hypothetical protein CHISP_2109 [Chitinispirillum alkaliphilum]
MKKTITILISIILFSLFGFRFFLVGLVSITENSIIEEGSLEYLILIPRTLRQIPVIQPVNAPVYKHYGKSTFQNKKQNLTYVTNARPEIVKCSLFRYLESKCFKLKESHIARDYENYVFYYKRCPQKKIEIFIFTKDEISLEIINYTHLH